MRDMVIAVTFSVLLSLAVYFALAPFVGSVPGQIAAGALLGGPVVAEYLKKLRVRAAGSERVDIYREAGLSWRATVTYGVLLMVGAVSVVSFVGALVERSLFASIGLYDPYLIAYLTTGAVLPALLIIYFQMGKLFALCRHQRWTALLAIIILGPVALRLIDFLLIPRSWFDVSFPWSDRTWGEFARFIFWTTIVFAVPLTLGAFWYSRSAVRLRVSSMMRLMPKDTQAVVAELVHNELKTDIAISPGSRGDSPRWSILTPEGAASLAIKLPLLFLFMIALTATASA